MKPILSRRCCIAVVAFLRVILVTGASGEEPSEEQYDRGKGLVFERCAECHSLKRVFEAHYNIDGWNDAVERMVQEGLEVTPAEHADIVAFLSSQEDELTGLNVFGRLHFMFLHFPIAIISVLAFFELVAFFQGRRVSADGLHLMARLAVIVTIPTVFMGLALLGDRPTMPEALEWHRNLGILTGVAIIAAWLAREAAVRTYSQRPVRIYQVTLAIAVVAVGLAGHLGGSLVHGDPFHALASYLGV